MINSVFSKLVRATVVAGILASTAASPAMAREGGSDGPGGHTSAGCALYKKLEKAETNVTALQFEYRSLSSELKKAEKGSKEEAELQRKLKKVSKRLGKQRDRAAEYFKQVADLQFDGIGC